MAHINNDANRRRSARGRWLPFSAALTDIVADLADRDDLTVTCAPGAGHGAPGCFLPAIAAIELDAKYLGVDPRTCDPYRAVDRNRYAALWGVLTHEAAHAHHSRWTATLKGRANDAHLQAAILLEESRIEAGQLRRRPVDRRWLRASATEIVMDGMNATSHGMDEWSAAHAAGLVLARREAGVFDAAEVAKVEAEIEGVLGRARLDALQAIWTEAHRTADDDGAAMIGLGRRWCDVLGIDPDQNPPAPQGGLGGLGGDWQDGQGGGAGEDQPQAPSPIAQAIADAVNGVTEAERNEHAAERAEAEKIVREIEAERQRREDARKVFEQGGLAAPGGNSGPWTSLGGTRTPTAREQGAARRLAKLLRNAQQRERAATVTASATPPGRLRMRGAMAADAQRAAGKVPTAEPFRRTQRRHVPNPPLRVGIACDVSGSMRPLTGPVAQAAYILGRAVSHVDDATAATVIYGRHVRAVTFPGVAPTQVTEFNARDGRHSIGQAVKALDLALGLDRPGAARLLVIVSDGKYTTEEAEAGQREIDRLVASGCGVLWLALGDDVEPLNGSRVVSLEDPAQAVGVIGQAAVRALRRA